MKIRIYTSPTLSLTSPNSTYEHSNASHKYTHYKICPNYPSKLQTTSLGHRGHRHVSSPPIFSSCWWWFPFLLNSAIILNPIRIHRQAYDLIYLIQQYILSYVVLYAPHHLKKNALKDVTWMCRPHTQLFSWVRSSHQRLKVRKISKRRLSILFQGKQ